MFSIILANAVFFAAGFFMARAFALYYRINPSAAKAIYDIYARNVSGLSAYRNKHLAWMRQALRR